MTAQESRDHLDVGEDVIGKDGEKLGTVAYVIVRPPELHVTDIVVSTGAVIGRDIVVEHGAIDRVADGKVHLSLDKDELQKLHDYVELNYTRPPQEWAPPEGFIYPTGSVLWPAAPYYPEDTSVTVNAPPGTVGLRQGMDVESSDGHKVGSIDALDTDPDSQDITAIVVKHGFLFTHDTRISVDHVSSLQGGRVTLDLTRDQVQELEQRDAGGG
ncbi:MAG TPA: PRC-barrel domain-containing protein [Chloroflexota bacterium]|nr:PRC-barrel domain-containing protein [Chloroflexota bacterium]